MQLHDTNWKFTPSLRQPFDFQFNVFLGYFSRVFLCLLDSFEPLLLPASKNRRLTSKCKPDGKKGRGEWGKKPKKNRVGVASAILWRVHKKKMFLHKSQLQLYDNQKYTQKAMV